MSRKYGAKKNYEKPELRIPLVFLPPIIKVFCSKLLNAYKLHKKRPYH